MIHAEAKITYICEHMKPDNTSHSSKIQWWDKYNIDISNLKRKNQKEKRSHMYQARLKPAL